MIADDDKNIHEGTNNVLKIIALFRNSCKAILLTSMFDKKVMIE